MFKSHYIKHLTEMAFVLAIVQLRGWDTIQASFFKDIYCALPKE